MSSKLIRNAIQTPDGTILQSFHRHDYKTHEDFKTGKTYMIDGGLSYSRRSANGDEKDMCLYDDEPHEVKRDVMVWGSYGKYGEDPLKWIAVSSMEDEHIIAVLAECKVAEPMKTCLQDELKLRGYDAG